MLWLLVEMDINEHEIGMEYPIFHYKNAFILKVSRSLFQNWRHPYTHT